MEAGFYMSTWFVCGSYCTFHIHIPRLFMGGYFLGVFFLIVFVFQPGAALILFAAFWS